MKKIIGLTIGVAACVLLWKQQTHHLTRQSDISTAQPPQWPLDLTQQIQSTAPIQCGQVIQWYLADVDANLGISRQEARQLIRAATEQWQHASPQRLFEETTGQGIAISLRPAKASPATLKQALYTEQQNRCPHNPFVTPVNALLTTTQPDKAIAILQAQQQALQLRIAELKFIQQQGQTIDRNEFFSLQRKHKILNNQLIVLKREQQQANAASGADSSANSTAHQLSHHAASNDMTADLSQPNVTEIKHGERMPLSRYLHKTPTPTLDILAFSSHSDLQATLLHQLGHALGLAHSNNPLSVMHQHASPQQQQLSSEDRDMVGLRCK